MDFLEQNGNVQEKIQVEIEKLLEVKEKPSNSSNLKNKAPCLSKSNLDSKAPIILLNDEIQDDNVIKKPRGKKELVYDIKVKPKTKKKESKQKIYSFKRQLIRKTFNSIQDDEEDHISFFNSD